MLLTEFQSKTILQRHGITTPPGKLATSAEEAAVLAEDLASWPLVLKAQIPAGGRARGYFESPVRQQRVGAVDDVTAADDAQFSRRNLGGIRIVNNQQEAESEARNMLGRHLVTGQTGPRGRLVRQLYLEAYAQIEREYYIALTIDAPNGCIMFLVSGEGGVLVEQASQSDAHAIARIPLGAEALDIGEATARLPVTAVLEALKLDVSFATRVEKLLSVMLRVFVERDATLIEINPFGFTDTGELVVLDASIQWDDNALFRQGHEEELVAYDSLTVAEHDARVARLNYHDLDGNIGTLGFGAAVAMATNDALQASGVRAANFLDVSPSADVDQIRAGIDVLIANPQVDAILINAFGGGILRCTSVCDALLTSNVALAPGDAEKPVVVRLAGVEADAASEQIKAALPSVVVCSDLHEAVKSIVSSAASISQRSSEQKQGKQSRVGAIQRLRSLVRKAGRSSGSTSDRPIKVEETD